MSSSLNKPSDPSLLDAARKFVGQAAIPVAIFASVAGAVGLVGCDVEKNPKEATSTTTTTTAEAKTESPKNLLEAGKEVNSNEALRAFLEEQPALGGGTLREKAMQLLLADGLRDNKENLLSVGQLRVVNTAGDVRGEWIGSRNFAAATAPVSDQSIHVFVLSYPGNRDDLRDEAKIAWGFGSNKEQKAPTSLKEIKTDSVVNLPQAIKEGGAFVVEEKLVDPETDPTKRQPDRKVVFVYVRGTVEPSVKLDRPLSTEESQVARTVKFMVTRGPENPVDHQSPTVDTMISFRMPGAAQ